MPVLSVYAGAFMKKSLLLIKPKVHLVGSLQYWNSSAFKIGVLQGASLCCVHYDPSTVSWLTDHAMPMATTWSLMLAKTCPWCTLDAFMTYIRCAHDILRMLSGCCQGVVRVFFSWHTDTWGLYMAVTECQSMFSRMCLSLRPPTSHKHRHVDKT